MFEGWLSANDMLVPDPLGGTFPVPVQPVQTYCVPGGPAATGETFALTIVPELTHPLDGLGESYREYTLR